MVYQYAHLLSLILSLCRKGLQTSVCWYIYTTSYVLPWGTTYCLLTKHLIIITPYHLLLFQFSHH
jgi:hypothetical protein